MEASQRHRIIQGSGDQKIIPPSKRFLCVFSLLKSPSISSLALNLSSKVSLLLFALFCYKSFLLQQCVLPVSPGYGLLEKPRCFFRLKSPLDLFDVELVSPNSPSGPPQASEGHRRRLSAGVLAQNPQCPGLEAAGVPELGSHHEDPSPRALEDPWSPQVSPRLRSASTEGHRMVTRWAMDVEGFPNKLRSSHSGQSRCPAASGPPSAAPPVGGRAACVVRRLLSSATGAWNAWSLTPSSPPMGSTNDGADPGGPRSGASRPDPLGGARRRRGRLRCRENRQSRRGRNIQRAARCVLLVM